MADDQIFGFDENSIRRICADVMRGEREARGGTGGGGQKKNADPIQWLAFKNTFSGTCPPRSIMRVTGSMLTSAAVGGGVDLKPILTCTQPDDTFSRQYAVSWGQPVAQNSFGLCAINGIVEVACTGSPVFGDCLGAKSGQWTAVQGYPACLFVQGALPDGDGGTTMRFAQLGLVSHVIGKTIATFSKGGSGTVRLYETLGETVISPTMDLTGVRNRWCNVISGKWVGASWSGDQAYLIQGDPSNP